jgi:hypothetical protein
MRPKKKILVYSPDPDPDTAGQWKFCLETHLYYAEAFSTHIPTRAANGDEWDGILFVAQHLNDIQTQLAALPQPVTHSWGVIIYHQGAPAHPDWLTETHLPVVLDVSRSHAEVLEAIRVSTARKRGPRKGTPWPADRKKPASANPSTNLQLAVAGD